MLTALTSLLSVSCVYQHSYFIKGTLKKDTRVVCFIVAMPKWPFGALQLGPCVHLAYLHFCNSAPFSFFGCRICCIEQYILLHRVTYPYLKKSFHANFFFIFAFNGLQIILLALPWRKGSKYVLRFEIGPREVGEKI